MSGPDRSSRGWAMTTDPSVVRIHAYEFGTPCEAPTSPDRPQFADLRMTAGFPASAVWRARLGGLEVRRDDLWRLLDPAATQGAVIVWPACLVAEADAYGFAADDEVEFATRVISLVRVDCPDQRAARWRTVLNVRSIAVAEADWQRYAPELVGRAPALLRDDFDELVESEAPVELDLVRRDRSTQQDPSPAALQILDKITQGRPSPPGGEQVQCEGEFWAAAAQALALLPPLARAQACFASALAAPFASATICFGQGRPPGLDGRGAASAESASPVHRYIEILESAYQLSPPPPDPGWRPRAVEPCEPPPEAFGPDAPMELAPIERLATVAYSLANVAPSQRLLLTKGEDLLIQYLEQHDFLIPAELTALAQSPPATALVRRILHDRPHAIVTSLRISLIMMANSGAASATLDACLRVLLPPRWSANRLQSQLDEQWALWQSLNALRRNRARLPDDAGRLEQAIVNRLACTTLGAGAAARRAEPGASCAAGGAPRRLG